MPGSLILDSPVPPKLELVGARSQLFQVPQSPSAVSSLYNSMSNVSRKRPRYNNEKPSTTSDSDCEKILTSPHHMSLENTDNSLTSSTGDGIYPTSFDAQETQTPAELNYQSLPSSKQENSIEPSTTCSTDDDARGQKRTRQDQDKDRQSSIYYDTKSGACRIQQHSAASWSRTVINMVGMVWNFCYSSAFRGFYAGGGQGYELSTSQLPQRREGIDDIFRSSPSTTKKNDPSYHEHEALIPGQYPKEELDHSWVIVPGSGCRGGDIFEESDTMTTTRATRRGGTGTSPYLRRRYAAPRPGKKTVIHSSRPPSPTKQSTSPLPISPISLEAKRCATRLQQRDKEEDASLRRLNKQLQAMIREGKEALGTQVEVEDMISDD